MPPFSVKPSVLAIMCAFPLMIASLSAQADGALKDLGLFSGGSVSNALGVNAAGDVVVGYGDSSNGNRAFRWTQAGGMVDLGVLAGGTSSTASGVNAAGDVVVGSSYLSNGNRAFRWTQAGGMVDLGVLAGGTRSVAYGVNGAGDVVVGSSGPSDGNRAFRWTQAGGMVDLGVLAGTVNSYAYGVNAAGDVVVGASSSFTGSRAFRWTQATGMQSVEQWLADHGVTVTGVSTVSATGVNAAGDVVIGQLSNDHAFIARASAGATGMIDVPDFKRTLQASAYPHTLLAKNADLVLNGLEGSPARQLLAPAKMEAWVSGDWGRLSHRDDNGQAAAGEFGFARGLVEGLEARIAVGQQQARQITPYAGRSTIKQSYVAPGLTYLLPQSNVALGLSAYYGSGDVAIDRGYLNAGSAVLASGSPHSSSIAARLRADWLNAYALGPVSMTPYASLTLSRSKVDAYTETGSGFPVRWDARSSSAQLARIGNDGVWVINDQINLLGRLEYVHRLNGGSGAVSGRLLGPGGSDFGFAAAEPQRDWLRVGLGGEYKIDPSSLVRASLNATTQSDAPSVWLNVSYRKMF
ncbi:Autotransporter beta-domain protein [compost metagenome]